MALIFANTALVDIKVANKKQEQSGGFISRNPVTLDAKH